MKKPTKAPTLKQMKSLIRRVGKFDDDASFSLEAGTSGDFETSWAAMSKDQKIRQYRDYMRRLGQKKGPPYRIFDKFGNPEFSD